MPATPIEISPRPSPSRQPLSRLARRLLDALAVDQAGARANAARPGFLAVAATRRGISTVSASVPLEAATALVAHGFAIWRGDTLVATDDGLSFLRRASVPAGAEPFGAQHRDLTREARAPGETPVLVDAGESPLAWLARRRGRDGKPLLAAHEFEAGERFRRDVTVAQLLPSVTSNWTAHGGGSRADPSRTLLPSEVAMAARQRVERALASVGADFAGLLLDACGFVKKLETIEMERGWPQRSAKIVLRMALAQLARHYGLAASATGPQTARLRAWGVDGYPLWADSKATTPNIRADVLATLAQTYGAPVSPEDLFAYIAAIMAHPAFTARFAADLKRPGLRLPLTADAQLFAEAAKLGRDIVWLHTYGERFVDAKAGRPKGPPRLPKESAPQIPAAGSIPGAPEPLPERMDYDATTQCLHVGKGFVENVTPAMRAYDISGKTVLDQWFSYRRRDRTKPVIGDRRPPSPLEKIQPDGWLAEYTSDLIDLLNVLGRLVALEPTGADLLARICEGPLLPAASFQPLVDGG